MSCLFQLVLVFLLLASPVMAQDSVATGSAAIVTGKNPAAQRASRARDNAQRSLNDLRAIGARTAEFDQAEDLFRRGDAAFRSSRFAESEALFTQVSGTANRGKRAMETSMKRANDARSRVSSQFGRYQRRVTNASSALQDRTIAVAIEQFRAAERALQEGKPAEATQLFRQAEQFLKRVDSPRPGVRDPCASARSNASRIKQLLRRTELLASRRQDGVVTGLLFRARTLLDDAARQHDAQACDESLRTGRLAENIIKRAAQMMLSTR